MRTLLHALKTCISQEFDDVEFLVCDNGSDRVAQDVVTNLNDRRLKYLHTSQPLAMTDSWEFAVGQAYQDNLSRSSATTMACCPIFAAFRN